MVDIHSSDRYLDNDEDWYAANLSRVESNISLFEETGGVPEGGFAKATGVPFASSIKRTKDKESAMSEKGFSLSNATSSQIREGTIPLSQARTGRTGQLHQATSVDPYEFLRKWLLITDNFSKIQRETQ